MGKSSRQATLEKLARKRKHKLQGNIGKTKSASASTRTKPSKTVKRGVRYLLQDEVSRPGPVSRKSKQKSREGVLEQSEQVVIHPKTKHTSAKEKTRHTLDLSATKTRKRKLSAKKGTLSRSVPLQGHQHPSSECIWEVNASSSDGELEDCTQATLKCGQVEPEENSSQTTKASVHDSPSITVVDLGSGFGSGTLQTVSLIPTKDSDTKTSKCRKPVLSSYYQGNKLHLGTQSLPIQVEDVPVADSKLKNFTLEERPMQSVFVVDLGNKPHSSVTKRSTTCEDSSKSRLNLKKPGGVSSAEGLTQSEGNSGDTVKLHRVEIHRQEKAVQDLDSGTLKKDVVKRKKEKSSVEKAAKRLKKTELREADCPSDEDDSRVTSSTPVTKATTRRKTKKKRKMPKVVSAAESAHISQEEGRHLVENELNLQKDADKRDEVKHSDLSFEQTQNGTNQEIDLDQPDITQNSLDASSVRPAVSATAEDVKESDFDNKSSSRSPMDEREDGDDTSHMDLSREQEEQKGGSCITEAKTDPSFRILKLLKSDQCVVLLPHPSKFSFHGRVLVRSLHGSVTVLGFPITTSPALHFYPLYSPSSSCALCLETSSGCLDSGGESSSWSLAESLDAFLSTEGETEIAGSLQAVEDRFSVALIFKKMPEDRAVDYVERFPGFGNLFSCPEPKEYTELNEAWTLNLAAASAVGFQPTSPNTPRAVFIILPGYPIVTESVKHWLHTTDVMPVVLVCGWKNTGKSTLCRYLANSLMPRVGSLCYLECDMAQTEFTPPGMLSLQHVTQPLLGPPFTHSRKAEKMCFYGDVNVRGDPESYLQTVRHLFQQYQTGHLDKPLIINTMGWMQGLGLQLLIDIVHVTRPTHIVQLWSRIQPRLIQRLTPEFLEQTVGWWHRPVQETDGNDEKQARVLCPEILEVDVPNVGDQSGTKYKASDHRTMALLAGLTDLQPSPLPSEPVALSSLTPLVLPWRCVAVHVTNGHVPPRQVMYALNGSLVGLCCADPDMMLSISEDLPRVFGSTPVCQCLGLGIIRGIDPVQKVFYILTAVSGYALQEVNTLLKGSLTLPQPLLTQGHRLTQVPYISREFSSVIIGSGAIKVRRNIKQRGR